MIAKESNCMKSTSTLCSLINFTWATQVSIWMEAWSHVTTIRVKPVWIYPTYQIRNQSSIMMASIMFTIIFMLDVFGQQHRGNAAAEALPAAMNGSQPNIVAQLRTSFSYIVFISIVVRNSIDILFRYRKLVLSLE